MGTESTTGTTGARGTRILVDTDAVRTDVESLRRIAKDYRALARELVTVPPDVAAAWRGSYASLRVQEMQSHLDRIEGGVATIEAIADGLLAAVSLIEHAETANRNVAETLAAAKGDFKARQERYQADARAKRIPFGEHSDRWIATLPENARAEAEAAMAAQGYGPLDGNDPTLAQTGSPSAAELFPTGEGLVDSMGHLMYDTNGNRVMPNGNLIDAKGNVVGNRYGRVNADGNVENMRGELVRLANGDAVDGKGNVTDYYTGRAKGNLYGTVDEDGNVRDASGRMIIYHDGNRVDEAGNVVDRIAGTVVGNVNDEEVERNYWRKLRSEQ